MYIHSFLDHTFNINDAMMKVFQHHQSTNIGLNHGSSLPSPMEEEAGASRQRQQCGFYQNPTVLSRLILHEKYAAANRRALSHRAEASVWVCASRQDDTTANQQSLMNSVVLDSGGSIRQLPIHTACDQLSRLSHSSDIDNLRIRKEIEAVIATLVYIYPDGCSMEDHRGSLPLHEAIRCMASKEMGSPAALTLKESCSGLTALELLTEQDRRHLVFTDEVNHLLAKGVSFWEHARQKADVSWHRHLDLPRFVEDGEINSIESISVLASLAEVDEGMVDAAVVRPHTWKQLEQRVIDLERLLAESYEELFKLKQSSGAPTNDDQGCAQARDVERLPTGIDHDKQQSVSEKESLIRQLRMTKARIDEELMETDLPKPDMIVVTHRRRSTSRKRLKPKARRQPSLHRIEPPAVVVEELIEGPSLRTVSAATLPAKHWSLSSTDDETPTSDDPDQTLADLLNEIARRYDIMDLDLVDDDFTVNTSF
jgi:hypothetical protein